MEEFIDGPPAWREWNGQRWYFTAKMGRYRGPTGIPLAQAVWASHNGPIPEGFDVHHINEDKTDDRISNLALIERKAHRKQHAAENGAKAADSEAVKSGKGALAMWANRKPISHVCGFCGKTYESRATYTTYCSRTCRHRGRDRAQRQKFGIQ